MASTASDLLKLELQTDGENDGTWGALAVVLFERLEEAVAELIGITVTASDYTLDDTQYVKNSGTTAESHVAMIKATGTLTGNRSIIVPLRNKKYLIWNATGGAFTLTVKGATGNGVVVPQGFLQEVLCDGTNVEAAGPAFGSTGAVVEVEGADVTAASTTEIWAADGSTRHLTGDTGIALFGTAPQAGAWMKLIVDGAPLLTHSANMNLQGSADIQLAAGDIVFVYADTTTQFDVIVHKKDGSAIGVTPAVIPLIIPIGDETTVISTGVAKVTFRMPFAMTLTEVRASLKTASSSGLPTFDINEDGTTILSTKLSIDANEKTSQTAATPAVISDAALADDAEITIDVDVAGTGAVGGKIILIGTKA